MLDSAPPNLSKDVFDLGHVVWSLNELTFIGVDRLQAELENDVQFARSVEKIRRYAFGSALQRQATLKAIVCKSFKDSDCVWRPVENGVEDGNLFNAGTAKQVDLCL